MKAVEDVLAKACASCGRTDVEFYPRHKKCKACRNAILRERHRANPEPGRARAKEWRAANPDRTKARDDERRRSADEKAREQMREYVRQWRIKHPDRHVAKEHARRARYRGKYSAKDWRSLCRRYGDCCAYCGSKKPLTVDHVVPLVRGGSNYIGNLLPACAWCNSSKGKKLLVEWRRHDQQT